MRPGGGGQPVRFLLAAGIVADVLLVIACGWRLAGYRREFLADAADRRGRSRFTFTAASDVLAARLAGDGHTAAAGSSRAGWPHVRAPHSPPAPPPPPPSGARRS
jgi:hypothetical protein